MVKRLFHITLTILLTVTCVGCRQHDTTQRMVSVTILPQKYLAEQIAGDRFAINCVVPENSNPESYDPTPRELARVEESCAYMRVGMLGFEIAWIDRLASNNPDMKIIDTSQGIDLIQGTHSHTHHDGHVHVSSTVDPHVWCSPGNVRIMAHNMYKAFVELDPSGEEYYTTRYEHLSQHIDSIDSIMKQVLHPVRGTTFAIYHPSLSYMARDYGLHQLCIENTGKESSAVALKNVVDEARSKGVTVVFIQSQFNSRQVYTFAQELQAEPIMINPLNYDWENEMTSIAYAIARHRQ